MKIRIRGQQPRRLSFWIWTEYLILSCLLPSAVWAGNLVIIGGTPQQERFPSWVGQISADGFRATPNSEQQLITTPADPAVPETQSLAPILKLPIQLYRGYLVVAEGSIGNVQKLNFLVDTGAYPSVIDQKIARRLGLAEQPGRVSLSSRSVPTRLVVLPSLLLGPVHAESLPVLTEDLSFLQKAVGHQVDGIVGLDVLRKSSFTINYKTKEMLFGPVGRLTFSAPFETDTPVVTVRMGFQNRQLRLVVDSGGPDLMLFRSRLPDSTGFQELGTEKVADASGTFKRRKVRIPEVFLGKETIGTQIAFLVDDQKDDGDNFDGVLGVRGPQFWKIAFDFEHRTFSWELAAAAARSRLPSTTMCSFPRECWPTLNMRRPGLVGLTPDSAPACDEAPLSDAVWRLPTTGISRLAREIVARRFPVRHPQSLVFWICLQCLIAVCRMR